MVAGSGACGDWRGGSSASCCCAGWPTSGPIWWPRRCPGWAPPGPRRTPRTPAGRRCSTRPAAPRGLALRTAVLGPPEELEDRRFGDLDVQVRRWPLPLWPHLYWEVLSGPGGSVLNEHLVRAPGSPVPPAAAGRPAGLGARARRRRRPARRGERRPRRGDPLGGPPAGRRPGRRSCGGCSSRSAGHRRAERGATPAGSRAPSSAAAAAARTTASRGCPVATSASDGGAEDEHLHRAGSRRRSAPGRRRGEHAPEDAGDERRADRQQQPQPRRPGGPAPVRQRGEGGQLGEERHRQPQPVPRLRHVVHFVSVLCIESSVHIMGPASTPDARSPGRTSGRGSGGRCEVSRRCAAALKPTSSRRWPP